MKKLLFFFSICFFAAIPAVAQVNPKDKKKNILNNPDGPSVLVKDQPQKNVDIQWKKSMMARVPGGSYYRYFGEKEFIPTITISSFYMSRYEVTFDQYDAFCSATGRAKPADNGMGRGNRPVINVSYLDAVAYCNWLGDSIKRNVRLPTEAEWEYAAAASYGLFYICEAGVSNIMPVKVSCFPYSGILEYGKPPDAVAWYVGNTGKPGKTMPIGTRRPNGFGLYDMTGNVREWCHDIYSPDASKGIANHYQYPVRPTDPYGPAGVATGFFQMVVRGGSYKSDSLACRLGVRQKQRAGWGSSDLGFRFVYTCVDCAD